MKKKTTRRTRLGEKPIRQNRPNYHKVVIGKKKGSRRYNRPTKIKGKEWEKT